MITSSPKQGRDHCRGWATIFPHANLPRWLAPGTRLTILRPGPFGTVYVEIDDHRRGYVRRHKINVPPLYFLEETQEWVRESHPTVLDHHQQEIDRLAALPQPHPCDQWALRYFTWILERHGRVAATP
jgi:hypothetical protein